jgi:hypothetical protein
LCASRNEYAFGRDEKPALPGISVDAAGGPSAVRMNLQCHAQRTDRLLRMGILQVEENPGGAWRRTPFAMPG